MKKFGTHFSMGCSEQLSILTTLTVTNAAHLLLGRRTLRLGDRTGGQLPRLTRLAEGTAGIPIWAVWHHGTHTLPHGPTAHEARRQGSSR